MACDAFKTVNFGRVNTITNAGGGMGMNAESVVADLINQTIVGGGLTCADAGGFYDSLLSDNTISLAPDGTVINPLSAANFSLISGVNCAMSVSVNMNGTSFGFVTCSYTGGVQSFDNSNCTWNTPMTAVAMQSLALVCNVFAGPGVMQCSIPIAGISSFNTVTDYVNCAVSVCATPSAPLPQILSTIKCANFSKIFNPLGIPLRSKK